MTYRVIVIWSEIPDVIAKYIPITVDDEDFLTLKSFDDKYINGPDEPIETMYDFFYDESDRFRFEDEISGPLENLDLVGTDMIIKCGFRL